MRHEKLFEPVAGPEPCGPDLDELGDDDYLNYVLPAEDRLPARFVDGQFFGGSSVEPFDRTKIDLKAEVKTIGSLLERSRDLRLLTLEARFHIAAGQLGGFAESIQAMAVLVRQYWETVHPLGADGDFTLRQNTVGSLDDRAKVVLPMQFAALARDKRLGVLSYRNFAVASGDARPREGEAKLDKEQIVTALGAEENRPSVEAAHVALTSARDGLEAIRAAFIDAVGYEYSPGFDTLTGAIGQITELIEKSVPALAKAKAAPAEHAGMEAVASDIAAVVAEGAAPPAAAPMPAVSASVVEVPAAAVASQQEAAAALLVAEEYFAASEPSAPALILIRQARLLIGKPLVAALEALAPQIAEQALIRLDGGAKFQLDIARMRQLSGEPAEIDQKAARAAAQQKFSIGSRADAAALIAGVEHYFRRSEPSSPVPMLLAKARSFMNQDFLAILKDLMGTEGKPQ